MKPKLSICCITYNHENYISETLDGFLEQKTNFDIEIIVCDDASTDNTGNIIQGYIERNPNSLKYFRHAKNIGVLPNLIYALKACTGKYIALCEGDDYWCDKNKLQTQVDFLESNPDYVGCFHNTEERYEEDELKASFLYCDFSVARDISFNDLCYKNHIATCSVVFKNGLLGSFPPWYETLQMGDWTLHLLNAQFGNFWYIPKVMAVHRLHSKSVWMLQDLNINVKHVKNAYDVMIKHFHFNSKFQQNLIEGKTAFVAVYEKPEPQKVNTPEYSSKVTFKKIIKNLLPYFLVSMYQKKKISFKK